MDNLKHRKVLDQTTTTTETSFNNVKDELTELSSTEEFRKYSRVLHRKQPKNFFFKQKIPWKTICFSLFFFIVGSIFLGIGLYSWTKSSIAEWYEFLLLGMIMFIPGSYHIFILVQILRGIEDYDYDLIDILDQD